MLQGTRPLWVLSLAGAVLLGAAVPTSAAGSRTYQYPATLTLTPASPQGGPTAGPQARLTFSASGTQLTDYENAAYDDRVAVLPKGPEYVTLDGHTCDHGTFSESAVTVHGEKTNWANMAPGTSARGRLTIRCTYGGDVHLYLWGAVDSPSTANCVLVSRSQAGNSYGFVASDSCPAVTRTIDKQSNTTAGPFTLVLSFTATLQLDGTASPPSP